jgi:hypothetical protein
MPLYLVQFSGSVFIVANDREDANEKFDQMTITDKDIDDWYIYGHNEEDKWRVT